MLLAKRVCHARDHPGRQSSPTLKSGCKFEIRTLKESNDYFIHNND